LVDSGFTSFRELLQHIAQFHVMSSKELLYAQTSVLLPLFSFQPHM
jgi:hypothetical protein